VLCLVLVSKGAINMKKHIGATAIMAAALMTSGGAVFHPQYHAGGKIARH